MNKTIIVVFCGTVAGCALDPRLELGLGHPIHDNDQYANDGDFIGSVSASVAHPKYKWLRLSADHISDPTDNDVGTTWIGPKISFGADTL